MVKKIVFYRKQFDPDLKPFFELLEGFEVTPDVPKPEKSQSGFCLSFHVSRKSDWPVKLQILLQHQGKDFFPFHVFPDSWGSFTLNPKMG